MGKTLINIKTEEGRKRALDSTQRLEDFEYGLFLGLNAPSPEETEMSQRIAEQYELEDELDRLYLEKTSGEPKLENGDSSTEYDFTSELDA